MPKIGKITLRAGDKTQEFELYYSRSDGFYFKNFPEHWVTVVRSVDEKSEYVYRFPTERDLISASTNIMKRFYEITAVTKRVIIVKVGYGTGIRMKRTGLGSWSGYNPNVGRVKTGGDGMDTNIDMDFAVGFSWEIGELTSGVKEKYFEVLLDDKHQEIERSKYAHDLHRNRESIIIDWTPARHEFFKSMERGMEKMAAAMVAFFGNEEKMKELIDTKGFKLLDSK